MASELPTELGKESDFENRSNSRPVAIIIGFVLLTVAVGGILSVFISARIGIGIIVGMLSALPLIVVVYFFRRRSELSRRDISARAFAVADVSLDEKIIGFFSAGGMLRGSVVYVTTQRIRVNRREIKPLKKTHLATALLPILALAFVFLDPWLLILTILMVIVARLWERKTSRQKRPSIYDVELGHARFEVRRGQLLDVEVKAPRPMRRGYVKIQPLMGDPIVLKIASNNNLTNARNVLARFEPSRIKTIGPNSP